MEDNDNAGYKTQIATLEKTVDILRSSEWHWQARFNALKRAVEDNGMTIKEVRIQKMSCILYEFVIENK